ncbi:Alpha-humulene synthase, partial [Ananas comosus]
MQKSKSWMKQRAEELKDKVKKKLHTTSDLHESMSLIDAIRHLGIDYHFTKEIDEALDRLYNTELKSFALHQVALRFRLLRQHGFHVSADEFNKFKDDKGNFAETLRNDPRGLLSLYNAAYLGIHGEKILDEAISFSRIHLESKAKDLKPPLANEVSRALVTPLQRRLKRLEARYYISDYEMEDKRDDAILELAKLDFNLVQSLHCEELKNISMWDMEAIDQLPTYLKDYFHKLISTFQEFEDELALEDKYRYKSVAKVYHNETEWYAHDYTPTFEEHLQTSIISTAYPMLICACFVGMGNVATKEAFEWVLSIPEAVRASALVSRLMDDITSSEHEKKRGHCASTLESYMKEHNTTKKVAVAKVRSMIEDAWKTINQAFLKPSDVPIPLIERVANFTRVMEIIYKNLDGFTNSAYLKEFISL